MSYYCAYFLQTKLCKYMKLALAICLTDMRTETVFNNIMTGLCLNGGTGQGRRS